MFFQPLPISHALIRLSQIMRCWANYFRYAVAKHTFRMLGAFLWHCVIKWLKTMHRWSWKDVRNGVLGPHGSWLPITADGVELINLARTLSITGTATGATRSPAPGPRPDNQPDERNCGEPGTRKRVRRVRRAAWRNGPVATPEPRFRPTQPHRRRGQDPDRHLCCRLLQHPSAARCVRVQESDRLRS
ncbi:group II intron maturase-specific domain-containing protein [Streptomyces sp. NPDC058409]|uniref:group II intron maturase-specific domain-containing protein n=1 Tax=Streptomyces sp. NPDC058409 TaxID=3346484 RepID=UPI00365A5F30